MDRVDEQTLRAVPCLVAAGPPHGIPGQPTAYPGCRLIHRAGELAEAEVDLSDCDLRRDFLGGITTGRHVAGHVKPAAQTRSLMTGSSLPLL